jgi:RNA chaperone Hfq
MNNNFPNSPSANALEQLLLKKLMNKQVQVFLMTGLKLLGELYQLDDMVIALKNSQGNIQMIYKHAISTIQGA